MMGKENDRWGGNLMPLSKAQCTNCGQFLEVDSAKDAAICPYCGTPYIVEKAINQYHISITSNNGILDKDTMFENWLVSNDDKLRKDYVYYYSTDTKMVQFMDSIVFIKNLDYHQPLFGGKTVYLDTGGDYRDWDDYDKPTVPYDKPDDIRRYIRLLNDHVSFVDTNFTGARFGKYHDRYKARLTDAIKKLETRLENSLTVEEKWKESELRKKEELQRQEKRKERGKILKLILIFTKLFLFILFFVFAYLGIPAPAAITLIVAIVVTIFIRCDKEGYIYWKRFD